MAEAGACVAWPAHASSCNALSRFSTRDVGLMSTDRQPAGVEYFGELLRLHPGDHLACHRAQREEIFERLLRVNIAEKNNGIGARYSRGTGGA